MQITAFRRKVLRAGGREGCGRHLANSLRSARRGRQPDASYDRLVNNSKRSFGEMLSRAPLGDNLVIQITAFRRKVLRVARKASRSVRLSCALGRQRDALNSL